METCNSCGGSLPPGFSGETCPSCLVKSAASRAAAETLAPDEVEALLPEYEIPRLLGRGGMGAVYEARHRETASTRTSLADPTHDTQKSTRLALKVLSPELAADPEFAERFAREAEVLRRLSAHPGIVRVFETGETGGLHFFATEYVDGGSLADALAAGRLGVPAVMDILRRVSCAVEYAHSQGVVHRDLKPDNILLGRDGTVKVADFGVARLVGPAWGLFTLTTAGEVIGTPFYHAPEQREEPLEVDARADVYALGVVLYEMVTGELPAGTTAAPSLKAGTDRRLDAIILRAMEPDRERRYQSVGDFRDALDGFCRGVLSLEPDEKTGGLRVASVAAGETGTEIRSAPRLSVLLFTDIVGSVVLQKRLGTGAYAAALARHDALFKRSLEGTAGRILQNTGDGFLAAFDAASEAVASALRFQLLLVRERWAEEPLEVRAGLHLGELTEIPDTDAGGKKPVGMAINLAARVMDLAASRQLLMTRSVFDDARQYVRDYPAPEGGAATDGDLPALEWRAHGRYLFKGHEEPLEVFEAGGEGIAPLSAPADTAKARRSVSAEEEETLGWRPGAGLAIPGRKGWTILEKLGEGGFGEVWLAEHTKTKEKRVFKFCFDADRLRSFKRELTFFRLLRDALGKREDIAQLHEVQVENPPFYLEGEFCPLGNLANWAARQGGIEQVPLETRLDLLARTACAAAAAHSVGVIHKDIKPSNIFITEDADGNPRPLLADFGIGVLSDPSALDRHDITQTGFTETLLANESSRTGTRLYAAPEYLTGAPASVQGDVYALGVLLYQLVAGDLGRPLGQGWERDVEDPLLAADIATCVDGIPDRRLRDVADLADRVESLAGRRVEIERREEERHRRREADRLESKRLRRHRTLVVATCAAAVLAAAAGVIAHREWTLRGLENEARLDSDVKRTVAETAKRRAEEGEERLQSMLHRAQIERLDSFVADGHHTRALATLVSLLRDDPHNPVAAARLVHLLIQGRGSFPVRFSRPPGVNEPPYPYRHSPYSPDGSTMALFVDGENRIVQLFDTTTNLPIGGRMAHEEAVTSWAFSQDGSLLATGSHDGPAFVWNTRTGLPNGRPMHGPGPYLQLLCFAPGDQHLVTLRQEGQAPDRFILQKWDPSTGQPVAQSFPSDGVAGTGFTKAENGPWVAVGGNGSPELWDVSRMQRLSHSLPGDSPHYHLLAYRPEQDRGLAVIWDKAYVFDAAGGSMVGASVQNPDGPLTPASVDRDCTRLALSNYDEVWICDISDGIEVVKRLDVNAQILDLAFSEEGSLLVIATVDGNLEIWSAETGKISAVRSSPDHPQPIYHLVLSPEGSSMVSTDGSRVSSHWDLRSSLGDGSFAPLNEKIQTARLSPDGSRLLCIGRDGAVRLLDTGSFQPATTLMESQPSLHLSGGFTPGGNRVWIMAEEARLQIWNSSTARPVGEPLRHGGGRPVFSADGSRLATRSHDIVEIWGTENGEPLAPPLRTSGFVDYLAFSSDGSLLLTASLLTAEPAAHECQLWFVEDGSPCGPARRGNGHLIRAVFSPDGSRVAIASSDNQVAVLDCSSGRPRGALMRHGGPVNSLRFSGDSSLLATASDDRSARVWDADTGLLFGGPMHHREAVHSAVFSPDGALLLTASADNTARLWDARTGAAAAAPMEHPGNVEEALFSPDGARVLTRCRTDNFKVWLRLWGAPGGDALCELVYVPFEVSSMRFASEGSRILISGENFCSLDLAPGARIGSAVPVYPVGEWLERANGAVDAPAPPPPAGAPPPPQHLYWTHFAPDGARFLGMYPGDRLWLWDVRAGAEGGQLIDTGNNTFNWDDSRHDSFSPSGDRFVTNRSEVWISFWDVASGERVGGPVLPGGQVRNAPQFSRDGLRMLTVSTKGDRSLTQVWDNSSGARVGAAASGGSSIRPVQLSPDGTRVAVSLDDGVTGVQDVATSRVIGAPMRHPGVARVRFDPAGAKLLTLPSSRSSDDVTARLWNAETGSPLGGPMAGDGSFRWGAFGLNGARVVTATSSVTRSDVWSVRIWDADTAERIGVTLRHVARSDRAPDFSTDGGRMVVISPGLTTLSTVDLLTGKIIGRRIEHRHGRVSRCRLNADGTRVVTAAEDGTVRVWDVATGLALSEPLRHGSDVTTIEIGPEDRFVMTVASDDSLRIWYLPPVPLPVPDRFLDLADGFSGHRICLDGEMESLDPERIIAVKKDVFSRRERDFYTTVAKWFIADRGRRSPSPWSPGAEIDQ